MRALDVKTYLACLLFVLSACGGEDGPGGTAGAPAGGMGGTSGGGGAGASGGGGTDILGLSLGHLSPKAAWVDFETSSPTVAVVEYGVGASLTRTPTEPSARTSHAVVIPFLTPDTTYDYRVVLDPEGTEPRASAVQSFTTPSRLNSSFARVASCAESGQANCEEVSSCGSLATSGTYYLLTADMSSPGSCLSLDADHIVVDLNGKTVSFAQSETGNGIESVGRSDVEIKNGRLVSGDQELNQAIAVATGTDWHIHHLDIAVQGYQSLGIRLGEDNTIRNVEVDHCDLVLDSTRRITANHGTEHTSAVAAGRVAGFVRYHHNFITGQVMQGMSATDCGELDLTQAHPIDMYRNDISLSQPPASYAISIGSRDGACAATDTHRSRIAENVVAQTNGRGIGLGGWDTNDDFGPQYIEVVRNAIWSEEGSSYELSGSGAGVGIRIRFGAGHVRVSENYFGVRGALDSGIDWDVQVDADGWPVLDPNGDRIPNSRGGSAVGIWLSAADPYGAGCEFEDNVVEVRTESSDLNAVAVLINGADGGPDTQPSEFRRNLLTSNHLVIDSALAWDGIGYNASFVGDTLIQGADPRSDFRSVRLSTSDLGAHGFHFTDVRGQSGADVHDLEVTGAGGPLLDNDIRWTVRVVIQDANGQAVDGTVSVSSATGTVYGGASEGGVFSTTVVERTYTTPAGESHNPFTLEVTAGGETLTASGITVTTTTEVVCTVGDACVVTE